MQNRCLHQRWQSRWRTLLKIPINRDESSWFSRCRSLRCEIVRHWCSPELADEDDTVTVLICTPIVVGVRTDEDLSVTIDFEIERAHNFCWNRDLICDSDHYKVQIGELLAEIAKFGLRLLVMEQSHHWWQRQRRNNADDCDGGFRLAIMVYYQRRVKREKDVGD